MALSASTWMGNANALGGARGGVVVAVRAERGDLPFREERRCRGVQPRLRHPRIPRLDLGQAARVARAHEQDVAGPHLHSLLLLRRLEVFHEDVLARLEPSHPANARHVEQHTAPHQPVFEHGDGPDLGAMRGDRALRLAVEERPVEGHVAEGVDVAVAVVVVVEPDVVLGETQRPRADVHIGQHRHVVVGGLGHLEACLGLERLSERDRDAAANQLRRGSGPSRREMVERPSFATLPTTPVGDRVEELAKLVRCHIHARSVGHQTGHESPDEGDATRFARSETPFA